MFTDNIGCPVSCAFIRRMTDTTSGFDILFGSPDISELEEAARRCRPTCSAVLARAFYALEIMYTEVLSRRLFFLRPPSVYEKTSSTESVVADFLGTKYSRDLGGLSKLKGDVERLRRRMSAYATVATLKNNRKNASLQVAGVYNSVCHLLCTLDDAIANVYTCMQTSMLQGIDSIGMVGAYLAEALAESGYTELEKERHLRILLSINE